MPKENSFYDNLKGLAKYDLDKSYSALFLDVILRVLPLASVFIAASLLDFFGYEGDLLIQALSLIGAILLIGAVVSTFSFIIAIQRKIFNVSTIKITAIWTIITGVIILSFFLISNINKNRVLESKYPDLNISKEITELLQNAIINEDKSINKILSVSSLKERILTEVYDYNDYDDKLFDFKDLLKIEIYKAPNYDYKEEYRFKAFDEGANYESKSYGSILYDKHYGRADIFLVLFYINSNNNKEICVFNVNGGNMKNISLPVLNFEVWSAICKNNHYYLDPLFQ